MTISSALDVGAATAVDRSTSAVSWAAIAGGAIAAAAISLGLMILGSGLGLATVSPWSDLSDFSAVQLGVTAAIWLVVMQWIASAFGGYLTGRMRTRWVDLQGDEILFRDTAHGFLAWALATLLTAAFMTSAMATIVSGGTKAVAGAVAASSDSGGADPLTDPVAYYVDDLFRPVSGLTATPVSRDLRDETTRIVLRGITENTISESQRLYLSERISLQTGLPPVEAAARVERLMADINQAKIAADEARKAGATFSILIFLSLLIGAFIASAAAALGGKHRDLY